MSQMSQMLGRSNRLLPENEAAHGGRYVGGWCHILLPRADHAFHSFLSVQALVSTAVFEQASQYSQVRNALAVFQSNLGELVEVDGNHAGLFAVVDHRSRRQRFQVIEHLPELIHFLRIGADRRLALVGRFQKVFAAGLGQKHNSTVGGDMHEKIQGLRKSVAGVSQQLQAPKNWIGSGNVNLFQVVGDILDLLQQMNTQLAAHTHVPGPTPSPTDAAAFTEKAGQASALSALLKPITL